MIIRHISVDNHSSAARAIYTYIYMYITSSYNPKPFFFFIHFPERVSARCSAMSVCATIILYLRGVKISETPGWTWVVCSLRICYISTAVARWMKFITLYYRGTLYIYLYTRYIRNITHWRTVFRHNKCSIYIYIYIYRLDLNKLRILWRARSSRSVVGGSMGERDNKRLVCGLTPFLRSKLNLKIIIENLQVL